MDSAAKIVSCMQIAAAECDLTIPTAEQVGTIIGISLEPAIERLFDTRDSLLVQKLIEAYKTAFIEKDQTPSPLFDGAVELLNNLKKDNRILAVATGKARRGLQRAWANTDTGHYFTTSRCADDAESKPSPDMIVQILSELDIAPEDAVMIGDTTFDMQMARDAGVDCIGVSYGVHAPVHLEEFGPLAIVHHIRELEAVLGA